MSAEEVKMLHEAIKLHRPDVSAEVLCRRGFTPEEWEMIDSLFAFWTTEDVNEELPVAGPGPQRRLERSSAISRRRWTRSPQSTLSSATTADEGGPTSVRVDLSEVLDPLFLSILNSIAPTVSTSAGECENKEQQLLEEMEKELEVRHRARRRTENQGFARVFG